MSKNHPLTHAELKAFRPNEHVLSRLERFAAQYHKPRRHTRVLDWGCGRGRMVLALRERGFDAFGVDPDPRAVEHGAGLAHSLGYPPGCLAEMAEGSRTSFPPAYFDFVFSNQVLEHVRDLPATVSEIARITRSGGAGLHIFPPRWHVNEAHLRMPFVHWLPKSRVRRSLIHLYAAIGVESKWDEMDGDTLKARVDTYYRYSVDKTFYRSNAAIAATFRAHGMASEFCTADNPKLDRLPLMRWARGHRYARALMNAGLATLVSAELSTSMGRRSTA